MMRAALFVSGRIVVADSHMQAFSELSENEKDSIDLAVSGFFDPETDEFQSDLEVDHFYNKEIYLVRHAETISQEEPDPDISNDGLMQIENLCSVLRDSNLEGFCGITSPLLRCLRTAAILSDYLGLHFQVVPEVMEQPFFLKPYEVFRVRNRSQQFSQFDWPSSREWHIFYESSFDFMERVKDTLRHLPPKSIVITHYGYICNLARAALCEKKAELLIAHGLPPASVTYINRQEMSCVERNDAQVLQN